MAARTGVLKALATPKHFMGQVFEGDNSNPWSNGTDVNRQSNDTRYSLRDLEQYYLPSFKAAMVDAGAGSVMCAYQVRKKSEEELRAALIGWLRCLTFCCFSIVFSILRELTACPCARTASYSTVWYARVGGGRVSS